MRKATITMLLLLVISIGGVCVAAAGVHAPYDQVLRELIARDEQDMNRKTDPLRQAEDAVLVDSTDMTEAETVDAIIRIVEEVYGK